MALVVAGRRGSSTFRFFVMAGLDPAIHENAEPCNQANDNVTEIGDASQMALTLRGWPGQARTSPAMTQRFRVISESLGWAEEASIQSSSPQAPFFTTEIGFTT
jgi:hypothetical protein